MGVSRSTQWRRDNPEKAKIISKRHYDKLRDEGKPQASVRSRRSLRQTNPPKFIYQSVKNRCLRNGIPFDLTIEDLTIPSHCPVFGVEIVIFPLRHPHGPSVDRIDPAKGYVKKNVRIISSMANRMKSNATIEQLKQIIAYMERETGGLSSEDTA